MLHFTLLSSCGPRPDLSAVCPNLESTDAGNFAVCRCDRFARFCQNNCSTCQVQNPNKHTTGRSGLGCAWPSWKRHQWSGLPLGLLSLLPNRYRKQLFGTAPLKTKGLIRYTEPVKSKTRTQHRQDGSGQCTAGQRDSAEPVEPQRHRWVNPAKKKKGNLVLALQEMEIQSVKRLCGRTKSLIRFQDRL